MGWSLQVEVDRVVAETERLTRRALHDEFVKAGVDPTAPKALHVIDNYRPEWEEQSELQQVLGIDAILEWSKNNFVEDSND